MKFKFIFGLFILFGLLMINFVTAPGEICIDFDEPTAPSNLEVTSSGKNIILTWNPATDIPDCSGIDYYVISRDGNQMGTTSSDTLTYTDINVPYGIYSYSVWAVDKVGHNSGPAIKNDVVLSEPTNDGEDTNGDGDTRVRGGGGGSSYVCYENWQCNDWSSCENEMQTRTCQDLAKCGTTKLKPAITRACSVEEISEREETETTGQSNLSRITGAVIGTLGTTGTWVIGIFLVGLIGSAITLKVVRKGKED